MWDFGIKRTSDGERNTERERERERERKRERTGGRVRGVWLSVKANRTGNRMEEADF